MSAEDVKKAPELKSPAPPNTGGSDRPKRVLIVDDDEGIRTVLEHFLSRAGLVVLKAANGRHALQVFQANRDSRNDIDIIVSDITTPLLTGIEFARELQQRQITIPVILISGQAKREHIAEAKKAGVRQVMIKPFKNSDLLQTIRSILAGTAASGQPSSPAKTG